MSKKYPLKLYGTFGKHKIVFHVTWNTLEFSGYLTPQSSNQGKNQGICQGINSLGEVGWRVSNSEV